LPNHRKNIRGCYYLALAAVQHSKIGIGEGAMTLAGIEPIQSVSVIF
jgi:hypothetical protein